jgi:hypothetical protein
LFPPRISGYIAENPERAAGALPSTGWTGHAEDELAGRIQRAGRPRHFELAVRDELGRTLEAAGRALNNFAFHCSPPVFAWFSLVEWTSDAGIFHGEDQEAHGIRETRQALSRTDE